MGLTANTALPPPQKAAQVETYTAPKALEFYSVPRDANLTQLAQAQAHTAPSQPGNKSPAPPASNNNFDAVTQVLLGEREKIAPPASGPEVVALQKALNKATPELRPIKEDGDYRPGGETAKRMSQFLLKENERREREHHHLLSHDGPGFDERVIAALACIDDRLLPQRKDVHDSIKILERVLSSETILGPGYRGPEAKEINRLLNLKGETITAETTDAARSLVEGKKITSEYGAYNDFAIGPFVAAKILEHAYGNPKK